MTTKNIDKKTWIIISFGVLLLFSIIFVFLSPDSYKTPPYADKLWLNIKDSKEIEKIVLCPLISSNGLTISKDYIITDKKKILTIFNNMRGQFQRGDFPQSFLEKWSTNKGFKVFVKLNDGRYTAFQISFNSQRPLASYSQFVNPDTYKYYSRSRGSGFETSDKLYVILNKIIKNNLIWVSADSKYWKITDNNIKYIKKPSSGATIN